MAGRRGVFAAVLGAGLVLAACGSGGSGSASKLSGPTTTLVLGAPTLGPHSADDAAAVLRRRLSAAGIRGAAISVVADKVRVVIPSAEALTVRNLAQVAGVLRFRQVLTASPITVSRGQAEATATVTTGDPLPGSESPHLTPTFMRSYAAWDCTKHPDPTNGHDLGSDYVIGCDKADHVKELLAPAGVEGSQVASANAGLDANGSGWVVNVEFSHNGSAAWFDLTKQSYEATNSPGALKPGSCSPPKGCNAIGIVLDGVVQVSPVTQQDGLAGGQAQISGDFSHDRAAELADVLKSGALPTALRVDQQISGSTPH
jgi:preprotein translocase subunit SecD